MSGAYGFSAADSVTGAIYQWTLGTIDFSGAGYPGPNSPVNQRLVATSNQGPAGAPGAAGAAFIVALVARTNIASLSGIQTIDGTATGTTPVLLTAQTTGAQNQIYVPNTSGAWTPAATQPTIGQTIFVTAGSLNAKQFFTLVAGVAGTNATIIPGNHPAKINPTNAPWLLKLDGSDETAASDALFTYAATLSASGGCYIEWPAGTLGRTTPIPGIQFCSHIGAGHFATIWTTLNVGQAPCDTYYAWAPLNVGAPGFYVISNIKIVSAWSATPANTWAGGSTHAADGSTLLTAGHYYFPKRASNKMLKLVSTTGATGAHPPIGELTPLNTPSMKLVGVPNAAAQVRVNIVTPGRLGVMTFQVSTAVGAASYGATQTTTSGDYNTYIIPGFGGTYGILISDFPGGYSAGVVSPTPRIIVLGAPPDDDYVVDISPATLGALGTATFQLGYGINTEKWEHGSVVSVISTQASSAGASWDYAIPATSLTIRFYAGDYTNPGATWKYFSAAASWGMFDAAMRKADGTTGLGTSDTTQQITDGNCVWEVLQGPACLGFYGVGNITIRDVDLEGGTFGLIRSQSEGVTLSGSWRANSQQGAADYQTNGDGRFGEYGQYTNSNHTGGTGFIFSLGWGVVDDGGIGFALDGCVSFQRADYGFMFMSGRKGATWIGSYLEAGRGLVRDCSYFSRCPSGLVRGVFWGGNAWSSVIASAFTIDVSSGLIGCSFKGNEFGGSSYGIKGWGSTIDCDASGNCHTSDLPILDAQPFSGHTLANGIDSLIAATCIGAGTVSGLANGANANIALPIKATAEFTSPTADFQVSGAVQAAPGQRQLWRNRSAFRMTIQHANTGSTVGNRFICPGAQDIVLAPGGWAYVEKSASDTAWVITDSSAVSLGNNTLGSGVAAYTFVLGDAGRCVDTTDASAVTLTVPPASSVPFPPGTVLTICALAAGSATIAAGAGVTIRYPNGKSVATTSSQYAHISVRLTDTANTWVAFGNLA